MKVAIANFSEPVAAPLDSFWTDQPLPPRGERVSLFDQEVDWGFHIYSLGVHLLDKGLADHVEFWDFDEQRVAGYRPNGVLRLRFWNEDDLRVYLDRHGYPDLFVNHGPCGQATLRMLEGRCFRVHVPALRRGIDAHGNFGAECYLVDSEEFLDERSLLYVPVVHTRKIFPVDRPKQRDFVYLASSRPSKRHDIVVDAVRGTHLTGHFHPVDASAFDLAGTNVTTSGWGEVDVVELLRTSRIAVYPGDQTSSPAAMWECVAAGLPIVVNRDIQGGKHLVVPGVTGELASEHEFRDVMIRVLANLDSYAPRQYFEEHLDTVRTIEEYLAFFARMGWDGGSCS